MKQGQTGMIVGILDELRNNWLSSFWLRVLRILALSCVYAVIFYSPTIFPTEPGKIPVHQKMYLSLFVMWCLTFMFQTGYYALFAVHANERNHTRLIRYTFYWFSFGVVFTLQLVRDNTIIMQEVLLIASLLLSLMSLGIMSHEDHVRDYILSRAHYGFLLEKPGKFESYLAYNFLPYGIGVPLVLIVKNYYSVTVAVGVSIVFIIALCLFLVTDEMFRHKRKKSVFWHAPDNV